MCGIVGGAFRIKDSNPGWHYTACDTLTHRGPDDHGTWESVDGRVVFGHRRLAIVDLSPTGHQPMQLAKSDHTIVFNGEIYNYQELRRELTQLGYLSDPSANHVPSRV